MKTLPGLLAVLLATAIAVSAAWGEEAKCPACGAPLDPGAAFCTSCGKKLEGSAAPARGPVAADGAVRVVAFHDKELLSTLMSILREGTVEVDSLLGSGFAVGPGEFVTDAALVFGAREITLSQGVEKGVPARLVGTDPMIGVALLAAEVPGVRPLAPRSGAPRIGEQVTVAGFPSGRKTGSGLATSSGVVSAVGRDEIGIHPIEEYVQTDAPLPSGFAGGPVVDAEGRYVGMSTALLFGRAIIQSPAAGIGMSIPADWVGQSLAWIRAGSPTRPWVGILTAPADPDRRKTFQLPADTRRVVEYVYPGSPAQAAGVRRGDGLIRVQGAETAHLAPLHRALLGAKPGETWTLAIQRAKEKLEIPVTLAPRPDRPRLAGPDVLRYFAGVELEADPDGRVAVRKVLPNTEASAAEIGEGDVLKSLFTKKDLENADRSRARWRSVRDAADLERLVEMAYSDLDFAIGLRFQGQDGRRRDLYIFNFLLPTSAL
jgi:S1-C subfamily serine protease